MDLETRRQQIETIEDTISNVNTKHPYLNAKEREQMNRLVDAQNKLLDDLKYYDYYYVVAKLSEHDFKSYLDRKLWHRSRPHPFLSEEEAKEAVQRAKNAYRSAYDKELFTFEIKHHSTHDK